MSDPARDEWIDRARSARLGETAERVLNLRLPRAGEYAGPCPACNGVDRFSINDKKGVWNCRGAKGGNDAIGMIEHALGVDFLAAVEIITGEPAPGRDAQAPRRDPEIERERREERRDAAVTQKREEDAALERAIEKATALYNDPRCRPIIGTIAEDYLARRHIVEFVEQMTGELRFHPALEYWGYADREAETETLLGEFFAMLAPARGADGRIRGVHRTYLARNGAKLTPPGDRARNKAKKGAGRMGGSLITLARGVEADCWACAEGIETALSWKTLADQCSFGDEFVGWGIASAYSLGNLCGPATGTIPHPLKPKASIPNGDPDMARESFPVPAGARRVLLLGDGDSDPAATCAALKTGLARLRNLGLEARVHMSPAGTDWNDFLSSRTAMRESAE